MATPISVSPRMNTLLPLLCPPGSIPGAGTPHDDIPTTSCATTAPAAAPCPLQRDEGPVQQPMSCPWSWRSPRPPAAPSGWGCVMAQPLPFGSPRQAADGAA